MPSFCSQAASWCRLCHTAWPTRLDRCVRIRLIDDDDDEDDDDDAPFSLLLSQSIVSVYSGYAAQARSGYVEWTNPDPTHTVLHWHFMEPAFAGKEAEVFRDNIMEAGPRGFWLMQDTILPVEDFEKLLFAARARLQYGLQ